MAKTKVLCKQCNNEFMAENKLINRGQAKFCSRKCGRRYNVNLIIKIPNVECAYCKIKFYKIKSKIALSKSGLFFCCNKHKDKAATAQCGILKLGHSRNGTTTYRKIALDNYKNECSVCKYVGKYIDTLEVHHKDKNRKNNKLSNLEILCRNCHYEEHRDDKIKNLKVEFDSNGRYINHSFKQKIKWPLLKDLKDMVNSSSYVSISKKLGVSGTAIKKYILKRDPKFKKKRKQI